MTTKALTFVTTAFGLNVFALQSPMPSGPGLLELWQWIFQQGGLFACSAILLYFWRRDMHAWRREQAKRTAEVSQDRDTQQQQVKLLITVVQENSKALGEAAAANHASTLAQDRLARLVDRVVERGAERGH